MSTNFTKEYKAFGKQIGVSNIQAVPKVTRVVVNVGVGKNRDNQAFLETVKRDVAMICGQMPHERKARKAVAGFKVRQGNLVGYRVTLRGARRDDFIKRFVAVTLPRVRDFRGISVTALDGRGNLNVGLREQLPFPEVHADKTDFVFGVQVTFVTGAADNETGEALFRALGFPLTKEEIDNVGVVPVAEKKGKSKNKS
ncbi:MAG: 50S ribosomal protein L5 [Candidatus Andersenbacteria bacterium]|nr:50S ribosomal protein L5 [bacterium]MDZ4225629.1 50S ribosomal protein L5 [Candidatus Andersenbacteria bacterium]